MRRHRAVRWLLGLIVVLLWRRSIASSAAQRLNTDDTGCRDHHEPSIKRELVRSPVVAASIGAVALIVTSLLAAGSIVRPESVPVSAPTATSSAAPTGVPAPTFWPEPTSRPPLRAPTGDTRPNHPRATSRPENAHYHRRSPRAPAPGAKCFCGPDGRGIARFPLDLTRVHEGEGPWVACRAATTRGCESPANGCFTGPAALHIVRSEVGQRS